MSRETVGLADGDPGCWPGRGTKGGHGRRGTSGQHTYICLSLHYLILPPTATLQNHQARATAQSSQRSRCPLGRACGHFSILFWTSAELQSSTCTSGHWLLLHLQRCLDGRGLQPERHVVSGSDALQSSSDVPLGRAFKSLCATGRGPRPLFNLVS